MSDGRTIWLPKDCAWWRREHVVELGEEFGPAGPAVLDWLSCEAKVQNDGGRVKAGPKTVARGVFIDPVTVGNVLKRAVRLGALHDYEEHDGRFTCTISGWEQDNSRGSTAFRVARHRAKSGAAVTVGNDASRSVTPSNQREEKRREEEREPVGSLSQPAAAERDSEPVYVELAELLDELIAGNRDGRRAKPEHVAKWRRPLRLMVEQDGLTAEQVEGAIRFSQRDSFWRGVILSAANLREHYDKLEAKARGARNGGSRAEAMTAVRSMLRQEQAA